jgi:2-methylcitrate dehydratase PrpD
MNLSPTPAERLGAFLSSLDTARLPEAVLDTAHNLLIDIAGLCLAARNADYVHAVLSSLDPSGPCTAIGHPTRRSGFDAALLNGTAAHGEDYDDTFEGGPVHAGAVIVPAVLAACERENRAGPDFLRGLVAGTELMCRLSLVAPMAIHRAGFHPTAVLGALAAAGACSSALSLSAAQSASALGIAGSQASGIIEYLAEGTWTKRMHAGWAAQSGLRAALLARGGFLGPRTVLEGTHGFFFAFSPSVRPDFSPLFENLGEHWLMPSIAFKPYPCGTMTQPYIDCAIELGQSGVAPGDIAEIVCEVGEGTVHRLWEPLSLKQHPPNAYAGKFSTPYCMAVAFFDRQVGFAQFAPDRLADPAILSLAAKIRYVIDPANEYPRNFTGHLRATLADGSLREIRRPFMRGGAHAPLSPAEIREKFRANALYGGLSPTTAEAALAALGKIFADPDLSATATLAG